MRQSRLLETVAFRVRRADAAALRRMARERGQSLGDVLRGLVVPGLHSHHE